MTLETVRGHFQELFRRLFGGGEADIVVDEAEDVLEGGIEIVARPPGQRSMQHLAALRRREDAHLRGAVASGVPQ